MCCCKGLLLQAIRLYCGKKEKKIIQYVPLLDLQVCFKMLGRNSVGIFYLSEVLLCYS